ncbi:AAA family ATPase [Belliella kenyensis]|uniref:AAA family ATPase n=1 Tax=Belliella kenyensis TaxID=1472724 RepID=A0ABV8ESV5_9BACT|nr:SMC family ATPase [Belliella kenyensis]MCH7402188.1 SMC family ATPase [Belliella kenyensis]MDN3601703.1 SMC family ATPase [Belliella kenyensis]
MIPIKLEIQGLYSYKEKQTIAFDQLTAAGLFGIFGAVGSGKSSILEAILLALYGSTERLSDRGEKNSMVNLQSDSLLINFEFKAGLNNSKTYIARYEAKRNSKNFEDIRPAEHTFYLKTSAGLESLMMRGEDIVGMKKEHFKQTVIIPQGKFKEFIDLKPSPRADMMKELFGLERFDLSQKTGSLLKKVLQEKTIQLTHLDILAEYTEQLLEDKEAEIKLIANQAAALEKEMQNTEMHYKKQEQLQGLHQSLQNFELEWADLKSKESAIAEKKTIYKDFLKAKTYLKPLWDQIDERNKEVEKYLVSIIDCERFKDRYAEEIADKEKREAELKEKANQRSERESKIRDLEKLKEIKGFQIQIKETESQISQIRPKLEARTASQKALESNINKLEEELDKQQIPNSNQLANLKSAVKDWDNWIENKKSIESETSQLEKSKNQINQEISIIQNQVPSEEQSLGKWLEQLKVNLKMLENEKDNLIQKIGLGGHVHLLETGKPCPLCGAVEHPEPLLAEVQNLALQKNEEQIKIAKIKLEDTFEQTQKVTELGFKLESINQQLEAKQKDFQKVATQIKNLEESLKAKSFENIESVRHFLQNTESAIQKVETQNSQLKDWRKQWQAEKTDLEAEEQKLRTMEQQLLTLHTMQDSKRSDIKDWSFCQPFIDKDAEKIQQTILKVQHDIDMTVDLLNGIQKSLLEIRNKQATNAANLEMYRNALSDTKNKIKVLQDQFETLKITYGFEDEEKLIQLFHHSLDADKVEIEIKNYEQRVHLVQSRIAEIRKAEGINQFSQEAFEELKISLSKKNEALDDIKKQFTLLDRSIKEAQEKLKEKKKILATFEIIEQRESNLRELERLFKGSGFVKYVSSIYLKELCNTANIRFNKLTKNSLSMEIDEDNTFWVVDYLNGGRRRLLKTLSGGQTFQASLCLALALAEKIKSLNQADQSFFFLDEGFGALDRNSLRVVFETLKALRHENRIVGIISHVEELQQEIEVYAKVELDAERGSQVGYSF